MLNQNKSLDNHHSNHKYSIDIYGNGCPSVSIDFLISQENFNLHGFNLEFNLVKEYFLMGISSSAYCTLYLVSYNENIPCSLNLQSDEQNFELTQDNEVIYDEEENNEIIKHPSHAFQFPILHNKDSLAQITHEIYPIYKSLDMQLGETYDLINLFLKVKKYDHTSDVDGFHLNNSDLVEITNNICPHVIFNMTHLSNYNYSTFESFETCEGVDTLKLPLMVMLGSHNPDGVLKVGQI